MDDMVTDTEQAVMVEALRYCASFEFCAKGKCPYHAKRVGYECIWAMIRDAADMIESLFAQCEEKQAVIESLFAQCEEKQAVIDEYEAENTELEDEVIRLRREREATLG